MTCFSAESAPVFSALPALLFAAALPPKKTAVCDLLRLCCQLLKQAQKNKFAELNRFPVGGSIAAQFVLSLGDTSPWP